MTNNAAPNAKKNFAFAPRQSTEVIDGIAVNQPPTAENTKMLRAALQNSVPVNIPVPGTVAEHNPMAMPDVDQLMWANARGESKSAPAQEPEKSKNKGGRPPKQKPVISSSEGKAGPAVEATVLSPDAPQTAEGVVVAAMPGQPVAVKMPLIDLESRPQPPKTREEYNRQQQQMSGNYQYPDVADVFSGRATGIIPISSQPAPPPSLPVQRVAQEVTVKHEMPDKALAYEATETFSCFMDGVMMTFLKGQTIYDFNIINYLLMTGCTKIAPSGEVENWLICPGCKHVGPPEAFENNPVNSGKTDYEAFARGINLKPRQQHR